MSVFKKTPTGYSIGYGVIFGFNNCGPKASLSANTYSPVGKVGFTNTMIDLCPADKHNGDLEHAIVNIDFDFSVISVDVAYHQWDALRYPNQMNWEFGHPVIYMAVGSHAHYPTPGPQNYYEVFNVSSGKNVQDCPTICHKTVNIPYPCTVSCSWGLFEGVCPSTCHHDVSVPYPCLETCFNGATAELHFVDYPTSNPGKYRWTPLPIILNSNAYTINTKNFTKDQLNLSLYQGRIGLNYVNNSYNALRQAILNLTAPVRLFCSSCNSSIQNFLTNDLDTEYDSAGPGSLATKDWWNFTGAYVPSPGNMIP